MLAKVPKQYKIKNTGNPSLKAKNQNFSQSRATKCRWIPVVLCPPCLSLSLLFCLDLCLIQGRRWSSHSPPLAFAGGRRVHSSWETSPGGRGASFFPFIGGSSAGSVLRHGARSLVVARGFELVRSKASRASEGPSWSCPTSAASCS